MAIGLDLARLRIDETLGSGSSLRRERERENERARQSEIKKEIGKEIERERMTQSPFESH